MKLRRTKNTVPFLGHPVYCNVDSFNTFLDRDAETVRGWLPKFDGNFLVQRCIFGKIFIKIR